VLKISAAFQLWLAGPPGPSARPTVRRDIRVRPRPVISLAALSHRKRMTNSWSTGRTGRGGDPAFRLLPCSPRWAAAFLSYDFWRGFCEIEGVAAIKVAPFKPYQTLDVARGLVDSGRAGEIAPVHGATTITSFGLLAGNTARSRRQ